MKKRVVNVVVCTAILAALTGAQFIVGNKDIDNSSNEQEQVADIDSVVEEIDIDDPIDADESGSIDAEGDEEIILDDEVPLSGGDITTTVTTVSDTTKKSTKTLGSKAKKSKTVKKTHVDWSTKNSTSGDEAIQNKTTVTTVTTEKYTKGSKKVKVTVKETETLTTYTVKNGTYSISDYATNADSKLVERFNSEGYSYVIDTGCKYTGLFSAKKKTLTMKVLPTSTVLYHELGHYLAYTTGASSMDEYNEIFAEEGSKSSDYGQTNADEYFGEAYKTYCTDKGSLKASQPKTFEFIEEVLTML